MTCPEPYPFLKPEAYPILLTEELYSLIADPKLLELLAEIFCFFGTLPLNVDENRFATKLYSADPDRICSFMEI
jgi:hypothetical protein